MRNRLASWGKLFMSATQQASKYIYRPNVDASQENLNAYLTYISLPLETLLDSTFDLKAKPQLPHMPIVQPVEHDHLSCSSV